MLSGSGKKPVPKSISIACLSIALLLTLPLIGKSGCGTKTPQTSLVFSSPPFSLLLASPLLGNEKEPRSPAPKPTRMTIASESVMGWLSPSDNRLRFPVELKEGTHLSYRLGVDSKIPLKIGDLTAKVYYKRLDGSFFRRGKLNLVAKDEFTLESNFQGAFKNTDADLSSLAPSRGELIFVISGPQSKTVNAMVLWGQPAIYQYSTTPHKNVLLIGVDTLRRDALSMYGGRPEVTPELERLSQNGVVFNKNWSQAPWTVPSFTTVLTGLYPAQTASTLVTDQIPEAATILSEMLLPKGFATSIVCGSAYLGNDNSGFQQGMECLWYKPDLNPEDEVAAAIDSIKRNKDRNWFLFLHIMDPHGPYQPAQEHIDRLCDPNYEGKYKTSFADGAEWQIATEKPPQVEINRVRSLYDAEVAGVDHAVGELFSELEKDGLLDQTLIIFCADHGEEFYDHGQFEHGQSLQDEMMHLPLMLWAPGIKGGQRLDAITGNIDITPTILDYLDLTPEQNDFPGFSLFDTIDGKAPQKRTIFGEGNLRRSSHTKYVLEWPYKLDYDYFTSLSKLYNLETDLAETTDITSQNAELASRLREEIDQRLKPIESTFVLTMLGNPEGGPTRFSGTIKVTGGISFWVPRGFINGKDTSSQDGDRISFDFTTETTREEPIKALAIIPAPKGSKFEVNLLVDGVPSPDRFYPYGTDVLEPSGKANLDIYQMPWPAHLPPDAMTRPVSCYIIGIPGFARTGSADINYTELDPQTKEQLRSLGYID
jgi:arylsulfatase A-like enzyme